MGGGGGGEDGGVFCPFIKLRKKTKSKTIIIMETKPRRKTHAKAFQRERDPVFELQIRFLSCSLVRKNAVPSEKGSETGVLRREKSFLCNSFVRCQSC